MTETATQKPVPVTVLTGYLGAGKPAPTHNHGITHPLGAGKPAPAGVADFLNEPCMIEKHPLLRASI